MTTSITSNEFQKEISKLANKTALVAFSIENPTTYFNALFSTDGDKLKKVTAFESKAKADFYNKGNVHTFLNGEII